MPPRRLVNDIGAGLTIARKLSLLAEPVADRIAARVALAESHKTFPRRTVGARRGFRGSL